MMGGLLGGGGGGGAGADGAPANRNRIINGNFAVNQRAVSGTVTLSAGEYGHDRWKAGASGCTYTFATSENITTITITAGSLIQAVEGVNLRSGAHVLSWDGTVQMTIDGGSAGDTGLTGTLTGGTNATIETSGTGTLSLVQLEKGSVVTPYEFRTYADELWGCQRYYQIIAYDGFAAPLAMVADWNGTDGYAHLLFPNGPMRIAPAFSISSAGDFSHLAAGTTGTVSSLIANLITSRGVELKLRSSAMASGGRAGFIRITGASGYVAFDAEL